MVSSFQFSQSMASFFHFLLFRSVISVSAAQQEQLNISLTSSLTPTSNSSWMSPSGLYAFGFHKTGNGYAVGVSLAGIPVWTANRDNPPLPENTTLLFNADSRLVVKSGQDQDIFVSPDGPAASASMLDSGNFVLYDSVHKVIWQSFDFPTDTILPGQQLSGSSGQQLFSSASETDKSTGIFMLQMQADGNLVQYPALDPPTSWYAYWSSRTANYGNNVTLNLDQDGRLYLLNGTTNIQNIKQGGHPSEDYIEKRNYGSCDGSGFGAVLGVNGQHSQTLPNTLGLHRIALLQHLTDRQINRNLQAPDAS